MSALSPYLRIRLNISLNIPQKCAINIFLLITKINFLDHILQLAVNNDRESV